MDKSENKDTPSTPKTSEKAAPETAQGKALAAMTAKINKAAGDEKAELQEEALRITGKKAAREMLLKTTRPIRLTRDCPTSKGRLAHGMVVRLPHREADTLVGARAAKELDG